MEVSINGTLYENVQWDSNFMLMETNQTLAELEAAFIPGASSSIIVYEDEQEIARYYNKGLASMTVYGSNPRIVRVEFDITQITPNAETEIRDNMETSDGAIEELAGIVAELDSLDMQDMANTLQSHQETLDTWFSTAGEIQNFINQLRREGGILDVFDERVTRLERAVFPESVEEEEENNG